MIEKQVKNTIKTVGLVIFMTLLGEGVLGVPLYWPFLLLYINDGEVFWLALLVGILVSFLNGLEYGLPSVILVVGVGILSFLGIVFREKNGVLILTMLMLVWLSNYLMGMSNGFWELILIGLVSIPVLGWSHGGETIHIKYRL